MTIAEVRQAQASDRDELAKLWASLWPEADPAEHFRELDQILNAGGNGPLPMAVLVSQNERGALHGFIVVGLRSHADGCDPKHAVGFVEGWFVQDSFRHHGLGRQLMSAAEDWARGQGCLEMASDALIDDELSHLAHRATGFEVVDRCVHFRKFL